MVLVGPFCVCLEVRRLELVQFAVEILLDLVVFTRRTAFLPSKLDTLENCSYFCGYKVFIMVYIFMQKVFIMIITFEQKMFT